MAVPLQYQSQFIPTNFGAVDNVLGMYRQDMNQREQQFDQSLAMKNAALSELGALSSFDVEGRSERLGGLQKAIEQAVEKRGGDYGAAAHDITSIISKERSNPWYQLNQRQVEQAKLLEQALARNPSLRITKDPTKIDLSKVESPEDIKYGVLNPEDYQKALQNMTKGLEQKRTPLGITDRQGYDIFQTRLGLSPEEVEQNVTNKEQFLNSLSMVADVEELQRENPQIIEDLYSTYASHYQGLNRGVAETMGMNPYSKMQMANLMRKSMETDAPSYSSGVPVGTRTLETNQIFEKPSQVAKAAVDDKSSELKKNMASAITNRVMTTEFIENNFTEEDRKGIKEAGGVFNYIEKKEKELSPTTKGHSLISADLEDAPDYSERRRIQKIKSALENAIDLELKEQSYDFYMPLTVVNPDRKDLQTEVDYYLSHLNPIEDFTFLTGELAGVDKDKLEDNKYKDYVESLRKGIKNPAVGFETDHGLIFRIKDNEGNEYLVKPKQSEISREIASRINPLLGQLDEYYDYQFQGDIAETGQGQEIRLPFNVYSDTEPSNSGRRKKYYYIDDLTFLDYFKDDIQSIEQRAKQNGATDEEVDLIIQQEFPQLFRRGKDGVPLFKKPFKTDVKKDIMDYYYKLNRQ